MMQIKEKLDGKVLNLLLSGNFDELTGPDVMKKIESDLEKDIDSICIDMKNVKYISSAGIGILIAAHKKAIKMDKKIHLGTLSEKVQEILDMVGIMFLFK